MIKLLLHFLHKRSSLLLGMAFLVIYWLFGYDGITFSDEVTYLQLGHQLWNNEAVISDYHFTSRWGAFLFSGFFTHLFGFNDRYASLATLAFYLMTLFVIWRITPNAYRRWSVLFFIGQLYLLHFLPKVYPDGFLILWVILIPAAAVYRNQYPLAAACIMASAFLVGFCTKETILFLLPFPLLLFLTDLKRKSSLSFYYYFASISLLLAVLYLGYYQWQFGDWFYRFKSVNDGHYISAYTYHDKGVKCIIERITYLPFLSLIDRAYWAWIILAIPGVYYGLKMKENIALEFGLCTLSLLVGFWFMTSTLEFYNPIYLNPRHLIIMVAPLAVCIASGYMYWNNSRAWKNILSVLFALGGAYSLLFGDWKIGLFYILLACLLFIKQESIRFKAMALCLILPVGFSVYHQYQLKNYPHFIQNFQREALQASGAYPLLTHEFIFFSREVLLQLPQTQAPIFSVADMDSLVMDPPERITLLVYKYYRHAYPNEQDYLDQVDTWIEENYKIVSSEEDQWISIRKYRR